MTDGPAFIDFYDILQVSPNCDSKTLESAYRHLAKAYHPDRSGTECITKFNQVIEAYRVLRNPKQRAEYDVLHTQNNGRGTFKSSPSNDAEVDEKSAINDADDHDKILLLLYKKRREDAQNAGVAGFYIQEMLNCSDERFEFHQWYLKEKGFILLTEQGTLAITIQGVDHVISMSRTTSAEKLLIVHSSKPLD